jgi:hypothetical protein
MNRGDELKLVPLRHRVSINQKLDDALDKSFPASDPVSLGHSDHVGQPKAIRKKVGKLPKGSTGLKTVTVFRTFNWRLHSLLPQRRLS